MDGEGRAANLIARAAAVPIVGYALLLSWQFAWMPKPQGNVTVRLRDGRRMHCKLSDRTQRTMSLGLFEPGETRLVGELLGAGDTFIDIGAHIGWFATIAARCVGRDGVVIACEPYPTNAAALRANLDLNEHRNVRVVEAALGSESGTLHLATVGGESGGVTALPWASDGLVEVPMATLDDIAPGVGEIALVKVDVEGWEPHVLRGAEATLMRTRNVLIEINKPALRAAGSSPDEILNLLRRSGFTCFNRIPQPGLRRLHRADVTNLLASR
jgi:FkbM family methyltransferase